MPEKTKKKDSEKADRRKFLKDASLISVSLAATSLANKVYGQNKMEQKTKLQTKQLYPIRMLKITSKQQVIEKVLIEAMKSRNMNIAINKFGGLLSRTEKNTLLQLSKSDLASIKNIQTKLEGIGAASGVSGGIIF